MKDVTAEQVDQPQHGFPHMAVIRESIRLLYKNLSAERMDRFSTDLSPSELGSLYGKDLIIGVQTMAGKIVRHLHLPIGSAIVTFHDMDKPGRVELGPENAYLIELNSKYLSDYRDISAVLAHEIAHVFLHRHRIRMKDTLQNEILTDTTAAFLGVGWPCLNAYRISESREEHYHSADHRSVEVTRTEESLGYLTPEEFGYVLEKRSMIFGGKLKNLIQGRDAKKALYQGAKLARADYLQPPLAKAKRSDRSKYRVHRKFIEDVSRKSGLKGLSKEFSGYAFDISDSVRVVFACPICCQKLRLPTEVKVDAKCANCGSQFACTT